MASSKIPVATTIPLSSLDGYEFYAVVIPEEGKRKHYNLWMFRKGCGTAVFCESQRVDLSTSALTIDGIKALDLEGRYDATKEILAEIND